jgi:hypothetical protein
MVIYIEELLDRRRRVARAARRVSAVAKLGAHCMPHADPSPEVVENASVALPTVCGVGGATHLTTELFATATLI